MWAARLLLGWSRERLGALSETTATFVRIYEAKGRVMNVLFRDQAFDGLAAVRATLEVVGIEFINQNGRRPSVRLRNPSA